MHFDWSTLALQTVNFAILVWLMHRFLYRPVLRLVDGRRAEVEKQAADARTSEAALAERRAAIEAERAGIAAERTAALAAAAAEAASAAALRHAQAEQDAAALLDGARKTLAAERAQALAEARLAALDLGSAVAGRLIAGLPPALKAEAWIDRIEAHLAALPVPDREALARQLADGATLTVTTAEILAADADAAWRLQLQHTLGPGIAIAFEVDPQLVAGAELHFPTSVLRFSWRSALASMRAEVEAHGNAG